MVEGYVTYCGLGLGFRVYCSLLRFLGLGANALKTLQLKNAVQDTMRVSGFALGTVDKVTPNKALNPKPPNSKP